MLLNYTNLKNEILSRPRMIITKDDGTQYFAANDGKRFYSFNYDLIGLVFLGIREDGNTRTVFNGIITNMNAFSIIDNASDPIIINSFYKS